MLKGFLTRIILLFLIINFIECNRIACIGDSITYGYGLLNREKDAFPGALQQILGNNSIVKNLGLINATIQHNGSFPYRNSSEFNELVDFKPDKVVIMLGTFDSVEGVWNKKNFMNDFTELIKYLMDDLKISKFDLYICIPPPLFKEENEYKIKKKVTNRIFLKIIRELIEDFELQLVDTFSLFGGKELLKMEYMFDFNDKNGNLNDGIHPSVKGHQAIAKLLYPKIMGMAGFGPGMDL